MDPSCSNALDTSWLIRDRNDKTYLSTKHSRTTKENFGNFKSEKNSLPFVNHTRQVFTNDLILLSNFFAI